MAPRVFKLIPPPFSSVTYKPNSVRMLLCNERRPTSRTQEGLSMVRCSGCHGPSCIHGCQSAWYPGSFHNCARSRFRRSPWSRTPRQRSLSPQDSSAPLDRLWPLARPTTVSTWPHSVSSTSLPSKKLSSQWHRRRFCHRSTSIDSSL